MATLLEQPPEPAWIREPWPDEPCPPYGLLARFPDADSLTEAARKTVAAGYRRFDAYAPLPIKGLPEAMGEEDRISGIMLWGGLLGGMGAFGLMVYFVAVAYPLNVGGRPLFDWPTFIPITFEMTVLCSALAGFIGMLVLNGLPMPYHPLLDDPEFDDASSTRFFLCIEARDARFDALETRRFLESLGAEIVSEVEQRR